MLPALFFLKTLTKNPPGSVGFCILTFLQSLYRCEKKLQKEMKKITRKLTINFIISGAALAGSCLLARYSSKLVDLVIRSKK